MRLVHWLVTLPVTVVLIVLAIANRQPVRLWPLPDDVQPRLAYVLLAALIIGFLVGELVAWIGGRRWRRKARDRARRIAALERELTATQAQFRPAAGPPTATAASPARGNLRAVG